MRRAVALGLVATALGAAAPAAAENLPPGRLSAVGGLRAGTGGLADDLGLGYVLGVEAGYHPMGPLQRLGWGVTWATLFSWYGDGSARVADQLSMVELDLGVRGRVVMGARRRLVVHLGAGGALLRVNEPVERDGSRALVGPWGTAGVEFAYAGLVWGVSLRYGTITDGSGTIGLQLALGRGK
ncbi:MAG: hypothetical protein HS111_04790 [Kofleriaceae bacterium]|nr:hypothetical protein [Kofleriaceae bacterium]MCL4225756.1 hypothetical protein [Myxococcales bacterium]